MILISPAVNFFEEAAMSETGQQGNSVLSIPSRGQSGDPSAPSIFTPQQDPYGKTRCPLVEQPLAPRK
jgi:hypothetical protein